MSYFGAYNTHHISVIYIGNVNHSIAATTLDGCWLLSGIVSVSEEINIGDCVCELVSIIYTVLDSNNISSVQIYAGSATGILD